MAKTETIPKWLDRIILFYSGQAENKRYAKRLSAKAAALGSEDELWAEADRVIENEMGAYPSEKPWEWEGEDPEELVRFEGVMRDHREGLFRRLQETDSYAWGLAVAGIVHLWERSVRGVIAKVMVPVPLHLAKHTFEALCHNVNSTGYDVKAAPEYPDLKRAVLVANAIKHGEGDAAKALLAVAPELFVGGSSAEHLMIGRVEFDRAVAAVDAFWPAYESGWEAWKDLKVSAGAPSA